MKIVYGVAAIFLGIFATILLERLPTAYQDLSGYKFTIYACICLSQIVGSFVCWGRLWQEDSEPREVEKMQTIMWAEQKPDLYDGPGCNEIRHRFECFCEGDMQSDFLDSIELNASEFPPGTKIIIQAPSCPKCGEHCEMCQEDDLCDFDWDSWVADKYQ